LYPWNETGRTLESGKGEQWVASSPLELAITVSIPLQLHTLVLGASVQVLTLFADASRVLS